MDRSKYLLGTDKFDMMAQSITANTPNDARSK
jgi:hypothetical protein